MQNYNFAYWSLTLREEHRLMVFENRVDKGSINTEDG
jgi:hypothetical protein